MAAAYLFHLVKNHAFNDGNKRIAALAAAAVFLQINGYKVVVDEDEFEKIVLECRSKFNWESCNRRIFQGKNKIVTRLK